MSGNKKFQPNMKLIALCNWKNIVTITILVERTLSHPSNAKNQPNFTFVYYLLFCFNTSGMFLGCPFENIDLALSHKNNFPKF